MFDMTLFPSYTEQDFNFNPSHPPHRQRIPLHKLQIFRQRILTRPRRHKLINVPQRTLRNLPQRLLREKRLMARHKHIMKRHQPHQHVVMNNLPRVIIVKQRAFALVHVQRHAAQVLRLERPDDGSRVNESTAGSVDEHRAGLHLCEGFFVDDPPSTIHQRAVQTDNVRLWENLIQTLILSNALQRRRRIRIIRQNPTPKALHDPRRRNPNLARADKPNRLAMQRPAQQPIQREIALSRPIIRPMRIPIQRLDQRDRKLSDRLGRIRRHIGNHDASLLSSIKINMVEAGAS